jgi:chemotaxis protein methyltransferase CheR
VIRKGSGTENVTLSHDEFRSLRDLIEQKTGIVFSSDTRFSLERRLRERLGALGLSTFGDYVQYLRFHHGAAQEWEEAIDLVTTNETYFFRENYALRALREEVLPMMADLSKNRKRLTIWSAGCSTGEEVYTLAIIVHESGMFQNWDVRVQGTDISRRCIAHARRGVYGASAFRVMPPDMKRSYFIERSDGAHVAERIRSMCNFGQMNLLHADRVRLLGRQDIIFCRNVLIYLDGNARRTIIDLFHERLYPGGVLVLGHSESLLNVSTAFELLHLREDLAYRKPVTPVSVGGTLAGSRSDPPK